jgi:hypothetical protein
MALSRQINVTSLFRANMYFLYKVKSHGKYQIRISRQQEELSFQGQYHIQKPKPKKTYTVLIKRCNLSLSESLASEVIKRRGSALPSLASFAYLASRGFSSLT